MMSRQEVEDYMENNKEYTYQVIHYASRMAGPNYYNPACYELPPARPGLLMHFKDGSNVFIEGSYSITQQKVVKP